MCDASDILDPFGVVEKTKDTVSEWTKDQGLYSFAAPMVDPFSQEGIVNSTGLPAMRKYIEKQTQLGQWTGDIGIDDLEQYFIEQGIDPDLALSTLIAGGSYASTLIPAAAPAAPIAPELASALPAGITEAEIATIAQTAMAEAAAGTASSAVTTGVANGIVAAAAEGAAINLPASVTASSVLGQSLTVAGYSPAMLGAGVAGTAGLGAAAGAGAAAGGNIGSAAALGGTLTGAAAPTGAAALGGTLIGTAAPTGAAALGGSLLPGLAAAGGAGSLLAGSTLAGTAITPAMAAGIGGASAIAPALAPAVAPSVGKALWELGKAALPAAIGAGTSLYLGAKGQDAATDAANIQAQGIQKGIDAQLEMFYAGLDMTKPFAEVQLAATKRAEEAIIAGAPQRTPYEGGELENFLLDRGDREAQRYLSKTGQIGSGRAIEEAVKRGEVAALAGRETHTQEQTNAINDWLSTKVNPDLALGGGGQVAQNQSSASQRAGEVQSQGYAGIGEAQAGGRISGYNALSGGYMGAANAVQSYFNPDPSREFYNALLDRMK